MKYQKLKRNLYTACVVANLFGDYIQLYTIYIKQKPDND